MRSHFSDEPSVMSGIALLPFADRPGTAGVGRTYALPLLLGISLVLAVNVQFCYASSYPDIVD
jgi:hypothetical protein